LAVPLETSTGGVESVKSRPDDGIQKDKPISDANKAKMGKR